LIECLENIGWAQRCDSVKIFIAIEDDVIDDCEFWLMKSNGLVFYQKKRENWVSDTIGG
jgi:hypothetical protein